MATYNFTVRATDNLGAYADRDFALTVNNTDISRFVLVGSSGLAHSSTGATWTVEAGLSGWGVNYGNGQWVVWTGLNSNVIRISPDAVSWTSTTSSFTGTPAGFYHVASEAISAGLNAQTVNSTGFSMIKWVGDRWVGFSRAAHIVSGSTTYSLLEYTSIDAINWTFARIVHTNVAVNTASPAVYGVFDFSYDAQTDTWVCIFPTTASNSVTKYRVGNGEWQMGQATIPAAYNSMGGGGSVINLNGLWMVSARCNGAIGGQSLPILTSIDGINWTPRAAGGGGVPHSLIYANGRVITFSESATSTYAVRTSTDAGRTWASQTTRAHGGSSSTSMPWSQLLAYYAGNLLWCMPTNGSYIARSTDDGTSVNTVSVTGIGTHIAVAARTT